MKKLWIWAIFMVALSCNDKLWDEIDRLDYVNQSQANSLRQLREENALLQDLLDDTEAELTELINAGDAANSVAIQDANEAILEAVESIDSLQVDVQYNEEFIVSVRDSLSESISDVEDLIELEVEVIDSLIANNVSGLEDLQAQVDSIQPVINNYTLVSVTNVTNVTEVVNIPDCSEYEESDDYILPPYDYSFAVDIYKWDGDQQDSKEILYEDLRIARFDNGSGNFSELRFRAYNEDGWIGAYGIGYQDMELPLMKGEDYILYEDGIYSELEIPGLGPQLQEEVETELELSFEFNTETGEYTGCVNTADEVIYYVNGIAQEGNNFDVGNLEGLYVITAVVGDVALQHEVELTDCDTCKNVPVVKKKVTKAKKVVVI